MLEIHSRPVVVWFFFRPVQPLVHCVTVKNVVRRLHHGFWWCHAGSGRSVSTPPHEDEPAVGCAISGSWCRLGCHKKPHPGPRPARDNMLLPRIVFDKTTEIFSGCCRRVTCNQQSTTTGAKTLYCFNKTNFFCFQEPGNVSQCGKTFKALASS